MKHRPCSLRMLLGTTLVVIALVAIAGVPVMAQTPAPHFRVARSTGPFLIPDTAASVDWVATNTSGRPQAIRVTVYKCALDGPRTPVAPGTLEVVLDASATTHNANSVSSGPFQVGFYYEVVMESTSARVLPMLNIWQDNMASVIPGTTIPSGSWLALR